MDVKKIIEAIPGKSEAERARIRQNAERYIADGPDKLKAAAETVIEALSRIATEEAVGEAERLRTMSDKDRVKAAFELTPMTKGERAVVRALMAHPGATSKELSVVCGWRGDNWRKSFGKMCLRRAPYLTPETPNGSADDVAEFDRLADVEPSEGRFTMKPFASEAFHEIAASTPPGKA